jgi:hypothetical protein
MIVAFGEEYNLPRQRGCYIRSMIASVQLKKENTGRESQGACREDKTDWRETAGSKITDSDSL